MTVVMGTGMLGSTVVKYMKNESKIYDSEADKDVIGWTWTDALYFVVITLSTVGLGDIRAHTRTHARAHACARVLRYT